MREGSATGTPVLFFAYDPLGRRSWLGQGNGGAYSQTSYAYDGASRLQTLAHDLAGTGDDQVLGFGYNPASQIVSRTRSNSAWEFTEQVPGTKSYVVNGLNQYVTAGAAALGYDANGNLSSDGSSTYVYDAENRLVSVTPTGAQQPSVSLAYDPMGRLWQYSGPQSGTLRFVYDGDRLTAEYNSSGAVQRTHAFGPGVDEPLISYELTTPMRRFYHADQQGSIVAVADESGNALNINKYDEWGVPAAANWGRFQYTGQVFLPDLGLYYYKARIYSSRLARFLQTDPVGYKDQVNLYAYVGNDPIDGTDPSGLAEVNLFADSHERAMGNAIDFPGAFTIAGHAGTDMGISDRINMVRYSPTQMLSIAINQYGYKKGGLTFLAGCLLGTAHMKGHSETFAQEYARLSRGPVLATTDLITFHAEKGGIVDMTTDHGQGFRIYKPDGTSSFFASSMRYDSKTGIVRITTTPETGTRIRSGEAFCVDPEKCGKK